MGAFFADQYSLLHAAMGVVMYFVGFSLPVWIFLHMVFEYVENTEVGIRWINRYGAWFWPGGKEHADLPINSIGDTFFAFIGWLFAWKLDAMGKHRGWNPYVLQKT